MRPDSDSPAVAEDTLVPHGVFAHPGTEPPLNTIFRRLRDIWIGQRAGRTSGQLAALLGTKSQHVSQWATGSDARKPPWSVIMLLCEATGYKLVASPQEWGIVDVRAPVVADAPVSPRKKARR